LPDLQMTLLQTGNSIGIEMPHALSKTPRQGEAPAGPFAVETP
jgi:hypothetical protein